MDRVITTTILSLLILLSAALIAIDPPAVWETGLIDRWTSPGNPEPAASANASSINPYQCSVIGPRIDWG